MKKKIALLTGGYSGEYVVSLKSASTVLENIDKEKYEVYKIIINKTNWYYEDEIKHEINRNDFSLALATETICFDAIFLCLHGSPGEDGKLQGYFDMLNIPYTGCGQLTSALTMNKAYTKAIVAGIEDLHIAKSVQLFDNNELAFGKLTHLKLPLFIKPNNGGSSIGMSKVKGYENLKDALDRAFAEDTQILVEEFITGREFSVGAYTEGENVMVLPATEITTENDFFDFEAKYEGKAIEITPGRMTESETNKVESIVKSIYEKLNCKGIVRIDYFLEHKTGNFFFIEINTIPGQTAQSFIPQQVKAAGIFLRDIYTTLIEEAIHTRRLSLTNNTEDNG